MKDLSIVIPVFNESENLPAMLESLSRVFKDRESMPEVIIVDDGSTDDTLSRINKYDFKVICHRRRKGYGASLKSGIRHAGGANICIIDADNTYLAEDINRLYSQMGLYDMIVGERRNDDQSRPKDQLIVKKMSENVLSFIFGIRVSDINSGLRIIKRDLLLKYLSLLPDGFSFTSTLTLVMLLENHRIKYQPVAYRRRAWGTKIRRLSFVVMFLRAYFRVLIWYFFGNKSVSAGHP